MTDPDWLNGPWFTPSHRLPSCAVEGCDGRACTTCSGRGCTEPVCLDHERCEQCDEARRRADLQEAGAYLKQSASALRAIRLEAA